MQTFLPSTDFVECASILDSKRLCKQIVECKQIINGNFKYHPIHKLWNNHIDYLRQYTYCMCNEYSKRYNKKHSLFDEICINDYNKNLSFLDFIDDYSILCLSHRVNLQRKNSLYYKQYVYDLTKYPEGYYWHGATTKGALKSSEEWKQCIKGTVYD